VKRGSGAVVVIAFLIACGAAQRASQPSPAAMERATPGDAHAEIERLDADITAKLGGDGAPTDAEIDAARPTPMSGLAGVCTPPPSPSETCADVCKLGDSICDDATRICDLAGGLPGDACAADRCARGKASCEKSRQRCCDCR